MAEKMIPGLQNLRIILASSSPRRRLFLEQLGLKFEVIPSTFPEDLNKDEYKGNPGGYVIDNALFKVGRIIS